MRYALACLSALLVLLAFAPSLPAGETSTESKPNGSAGPNGADKPASAESAALFDQLDRNGDAQLTSDEVPDDKQALFGRLLKTSDKDGDGALSRGEFAAGLESKRPERPLAERLPDDDPATQLLRNPEKVFARLDRNADGKIVAGEVPDQAQPIFEKLLAYADKNSDGVLTRQELTDAVAGFKASVAGTVAEMEPAKLFDYLDKNADGKLTKDELPEGRPMLLLIMQRGDKNGDGAVNVEEFTTVVEAWRRIGKGQLGNAGGQAPPAGGQPAKPATSAGSQSGSADAKAEEPGLGARTGRLPQHFAKMDANHDGKISREEFTGPQKKRFDRIDANADGFLETEEIQRFVAAAGQKLKAAAGNFKKAAAPMPKGDAMPANDKSKAEADE